MAALIHRIPAYLRLSWALALEPRLSRRRRAAVIGAAAYLASPIDLVPGIVPILGQLDDLLLALGALRLALNGLDPAVRAVHLGKVGLTDADLGADARTVGVAAAWTARRGARIGARTAVASARVGATVARVTGRAMGRAALVGGRLAVRGGRATGARLGDAGAGVRDRLGRGAEGHPPGS
jgi:uncharacterized membrane protein YkvA (DUF1232 family)